MTQERSIPVTAHGRYLVAMPSRAAGPLSKAALLVGFHGYAEDAEIHLERLQSIPDSDRWLVVSVQALHRFYRGRSRDVVASWMTRQNRELAVADNGGAHGEKGALGIRSGVRHGNCAPEVLCEARGLVRYG